MDAPTAQSPRADDRAPSFPALAQRIADASQAAGEVAKRLGVPALAERLQHETARRLASERVRVLVIGEINHGKSTLVNALIRQPEATFNPLLPMGVMPTTSALIAVAHGPQLRVRAQLQGGESLDVAADDLPALARGEKVIAGAWRIEVDAPDFALPANVEIVDTPGFNDLSRYRSLLSASELPHADVFLLVLDCTQPMSATELELVGRAIEATGGLGRSGAQLWVALNRADLVADLDDRKALRARIEGLLASVGVEPSKMVFTAAKQALRSAGEPDAVHGVHELAQALRELAGLRQQILPVRAKAEVAAQIGYLQTLAQVHARALHLQREERDVQLRRLQEDAAQSSEALVQVRRMIQTRSDTLQTQVDEALASVQQQVFAEVGGAVDRLDMQQLVGYLPGVVREVILDRCAEASRALRDELDRLHDDVLRASSDLSARAFADAKAVLRVETSPLFVPTSSWATDAMSIVLGVVGTIMMSTSHVPLGMTMTIAAPLAHLALRERALRDLRRRVKGALPGALDEAFATTRVQWRQAIAEVALRLQEALARGHALLHAEVLQTLALAEDRIERGEHGRAQLEIERDLLTLRELAQDLQADEAQAT